MFFFVNRSPITFPNSKKKLVKYTFVNESNFTVSLYPLDQLVINYTLLEQLSFSQLKEKVSPCMQLCLLAEEEPSEFLLYLIKTRTDMFFTTLYSIAGQLIISSEYRVTNEKHKIMQWFQIPLYVSSKTCPSKLLYFGSNKLVNNGK